MKRVQQVEHVYKTKMPRKLSVKLALPISQRAFTAVRIGSGIMSLLYWRISFDNNCVEKGSCSTNANLILYRFDSLDTSSAWS